MPYQPVTDAGKQLQEQLKTIVERQISQAGAAMNSATKNALAEFSSEAASLVAQDSDELEQLKVKLEALKAAGGQDAAALKTLTEDAILALKRRQEALMKMGKLAVAAAMKAVGIPV